MSITPWPYAIFCSHAYILWLNRLRVLNDVHDQVGKPLQNMLRIETYRYFFKLWMVVVANVYLEGWGHVLADF